MQILSSLTHPNIINLKEICLTKPSKKNGFRGSTFLVFEYMEYDFTGILNKINFNLAHLKCAMKQILLALEHLHGNNIIHRDLKTANILMNSRGNVKLGDFGLAKKIQPNMAHTPKVVTLWYRAPQLLFQTNRYTEKVDIWSAGCILVELCIKRVLFKGDIEYRQSRLIYEICGDPVANNWKPHYQKQKEHIYNDFMPKKDQCKYPRRLKEELTKNICPLMPASFIDLIDSMLQLNPDCRVTASQALAHPFFQEEPTACKGEELPQFHSNLHEKEQKKIVRSAQQQKTLEQRYGFSEYEKKHDKEEHRVEYWKEKEKRHYSKEGEDYKPRFDKRPFFDNKWKQKARPFQQQRRYGRMDTQRKRHVEDQMYHYSKKQRQNDEPEEGEIMSQPRKR